MVRKRYEDISVDVVRIYCCFRLAEDCTTRLERLLRALLHSTTGLSNLQNIRNCWRDYES